MKYSKTKIYILIFITSFIGTIFYQSYQKVHDVLYQKWQEQEPAYDTFNEHISSLVLGFARVKLYELGIDYESWIQIYLKDLHKKAYDSALSKISENDGERIIWWTQYEFYPLYNADKKEFAPYLVEKVFPAFVNLNYKPIASPWMDKVGRYTYSSVLLSYFTYNVKHSKLDKEVYISKRNEIINISLEYLKTIKKDLFFEHKLSAHKIVPLRFFHITYELLLSDLKQEDHIDCDSNKIEGLKFVVDNLIILHKEYSDIKLDAPRIKDLEDSKYRLQKSLPEVDQILKINCNKTI